MLKTVMKIIFGVLAALGVLFIILMLIPDDENEAAGSETYVEQATQESQDAGETNDVQELSEVQETSQLQEDTEDDPTEDQNIIAVTIDIPESEISGKKLKFTTRTLDGKKVNQDIFSDYDITLVHVWGTYCGPCIAEMDKYAKLYENIPENVNLIGIIWDVYDETDNNVDSANEILSDAGAGFMNLRTSDSIYDETAQIQLLPSSFFVEREGHIIGDMMQGAHYEETVSRLYGYIK